jgi:hypothetical protein
VYISGKTKRTKERWSYLCFLHCSGDWPRLFFFVANSMDSEKRRRERRDDPISISSGKGKRQTETREQKTRTRSFLVPVVLENNFHHNKSNNNSNLSKNNLFLRRFLKKSYFRQRRLEKSEDKISREKSELLEETAFETLS